MYPLNHIRPLLYLMILGLSLECFAGLKNASSITITENEASVICKSGTKEITSLANLRLDLVCGDAESTGIKTLGLIKQFDYNGYCEDADKKEALEIVKKYLERKAKQECYTNGYSKMLPVDFTNGVGCKAYFGPYVTAEIYFRCSY